MLGSNEREHGWLDEGLNSFNENRYIETKYPDQKLIGNIADGPIEKDLTSPDTNINLNINSPIYSCCKKMRIRL